MITHTAGRKILQKNIRFSQSHRSGDRVDVLLVFMPFGDAVLPSLGLGLLKAGLENRGMTSQVAYYNIAFAKEIGLRLYSWLSQAAPGSLMLGEWVFSNTAFCKEGAATVDAQDQALFELLSAGGIQDSRGKVQSNAEPNAAQRKIALKSLSTYGLNPHDLQERLIKARDMAALFTETCARQIASINPRILGFSTTFCQTCSSLAVARRVKETMGSKAPLVIFGGSNCQGRMGYAILKAFPWIDYACCGEGDQAFVEFASHFLNGTTHPRIQGIPGGNGEGRDEFTVPQPITKMDELPFPDFDDYFATLETFGLVGKVPNLLSVETSRGCWWGERSQCTFCGFNGNAMAFRSKTPERALNELDHLSRRYNCREFFVADNILGLDFFESVFPEIIRRGMKLKPFFETKSNLNRKQILLLREVGVRKIQPGIESLSDHALRLMRKGVSGLQNVLLLRCCREAGIRPFWNWLWGFPDEDPREYEKMLEWIPLLTHLQPPEHCGRIRLDRFSTLFESQRTLGIANVRPSLPYRLIYPLDQETLYGLAYHFDFDYLDGRNPDKYTAELADEILDWITVWCRRFGPPVLTMLDLGARIAFCDTRPIATQRLLMLKGIEAVLYRYLADIRERNTLIKHFVDLGNDASVIDEALSALARKKLILVDSNRYLALAYNVPVFLKRKLIR